MIRLSFCEKIKKTRFRKKPMESPPCPCFICTPSIHDKQQSNIREKSAQGISAENKCSWKINACGKNDMDFGRNLQ